MIVAQQEQHAQWLSELLATVPWIVLFLFTWFFIYRFLKKEKRRREELAEAQAQVAHLKQQLEELSAKERGEG